MFIHCNRKFKSLEIWFLYDNKDFLHRKLYLGTCPICGADIVALIETRKSDNKVFKDFYYKKKAVDILQKVINEVEYTNQDIRKFKRTPFGFCYGENIEIHNSKGEVIEIRQKRCDYFGNKEILKVV